jgi:hypothetical protein
MVQETLSVIRYNMLYELISPTELIHHIANLYDLDSFSANYTRAEKEMFDANIYPAGYRVFIDKEKAESLFNNYPVLSTGIMSFLEENDFDEFWLDEDE